MTKLIVKKTNVIRIAWHFMETTLPYSLEVNDRVKGWVTLMMYETWEEALAGMEALIRSNRKEAE